MRNALILLLAACASLSAGEWLQFRGPNASGVSAAGGIPEEFGPDRNVLWKTPVPPGHSSPVIAADRIFLTAVEGDELTTLALDRESGRLLWRRIAPRSRVSKTHRVNNAAAPSPVSDGQNVYVFFGDSGLLAYDRDGVERWRLPLGPFQNGMGMAASPILAEGKLVLAADADTGSYLMAVDPENGEILWKRDRAEFTRGFSTPVIYQPDDGPAEVILSGAFRVAGYALSSGEELWSARGLCWQTKSVAVLGDGRVYVHCWAAGGDRPPTKTYPPFADAKAAIDADGDGFIIQAELYEELHKKFGSFDLNKDKKLDGRDWAYLEAKTSSRNALMAVRLGGRGDVTDTHVEWSYRRQLPNVASPLLYDGVLYLVKDGGIVTSVDAVTGKPIKTGRLPGAMGKYFASPIAVDGRILFFDGAGTLSIVRAGGEWEVLDAIEFGEGANATPAAVDGRLYVRTHENLYCFGR